MELLNALTEMVMGKVKRAEGWLKSQAWWAWLIVLTLTGACCILATCWSIVATVGEEPRHTAVPTSSPIPTATTKLTSTPRSTRTQQPTQTLPPTFVPAPTSIPIPSATSTPFSTDLPTDLPTAEPQPTETPSPLPTPTAVLTIAVPTKTPTTAPVPVLQVWLCPETTKGAAYMGSVNSDKFHKLSCGTGQRIKAENRICFVNREAAIAAGYEPCGNCNP